MRPGVHGRHGRWSAGGILTYAADDLLAEIAYLARTLHWPFGTLLDLEHPDRHRLIELVAGDPGFAGDPGAADHPNPQPT